MKSNSDFKKSFIKMAELMAQHSNCVKYKVGCVIVKEKRPVVMGYNGTPSGFINCGSVFPKKDFDRLKHRDWADKHEVHAEMNAIIFAAKNGIPLEGADLYCTHKPCFNCMKHIISVGIKKIFYKDSIKDLPYTKEMEDFIFKNRILIERVI
jgi:dCMP deaminase